MFNVVATVLFCAKNVGGGGGGDQIANFGKKSLKFIYLLNENDLKPPLPF